MPCVRLEPSQESMAPALADRNPDRSIKFNRTNIYILEDRVRKSDWIKTLRFNCYINLQETPEPFKRCPRHLASESSSP